MDKVRTYKVKYKELKAINVTRDFDKVKLPHGVTAKKSHKEGEFFIEQNGNGIGWVYVSNVVLFPKNGKVFFLNGSSFGRVFDEGIIEQIDQRGEA